ncbi:MAG TPA: phosphoribosylformylglycinamidine synthase subunit PurL [Pirellulales bacterium]
MMLWEVDIYPASGEPDRAGQAVVAAAQQRGFAPGELRVAAAHGYLVQGALESGQIDRIARDLLVDNVVERSLIGSPGEARLSDPRAAGLDASAKWQLVYVLPKPGVMDPVAQSTLSAIVDLQLTADAVRTFRKYWVAGPGVARLESLCSQVLANDAIEQVIVGPLPFDHLELGTPYQFQLVTIPLRSLSDDQLVRLSREGQLYLNLAEMQTIQAHFRELSRDPTDIELETLAQTWSEHCSHKTLAGRIAYRGPEGSRTFGNMLKETIFAATQSIRESLGANDWCVSVFSDNAGIVRFDDEYNVAFKVETHNHPSALEPYGGANTGIGGVIRDTLGTGLGAKPVCNTDVFCFAPPETPAEAVPPGALHPRRVIQGVVAGVRDYGNRMGIPTVNGAIYFDPRYVGNPLVYCGSVGIIPRDKSFKKPEPNDYIVALGGHTGRDGIHGATFSSGELTHESESLSGGAVQIGNAITEKMLLDVILQARDRGLYHAITDCGAGGFSSAVGEMGELIGAEVWLDRAPVKYEGLSYTEIWISEAQERMVLSVGADQWPAFAELAASEGVSATIIGQFVSGGRLQLKYDGQVVGELSMEFLHGGRPPVVREAVYEVPSERELPASSLAGRDLGAALKQILGSLDVASKHWVIRQYDHEVQGGSVVKPLVGAHNDGPSDAAVLRPVLSSQRAIVVGCGMNPRYGEFDTYHMAASAIDEAVRNCIAVGADPTRIAILDNFCWGNTDRPQTLGSLVRAALACHDVAVTLETPFISGKDSLNNEFRYVDAAGKQHVIGIPPSLLISALGQMDDASQAVTMDFKKPGSAIYLVGSTRDELGGSQLSNIWKLSGGRVPQVDVASAKRTFVAVHKTITAGLVRACHDLSEGGLAVALAEMAFAGALGASLDLAGEPSELNAGPGRDVILLFSESNTRFLCEVAPENCAQFEKLLSGLPHAKVGQVTAEPALVINSGATHVFTADTNQLKAAWQAPLDWN